eukprot:TRINITY_DN2006_c0_g1_i7.p1 TRINITY_DN2006_c0_g1~~TRINITY_DN2006_c0_g1_i7.p1  ORF type:complete len:123 (-),score=7.39 TRINITY_DN2006_c0_g1_i7:354-722(-)
MSMITKYITVLPSILYCKCTESTQCNVRLIRPQVAFSYISTLLIPHDQEYNGAPVHCTQSTQTTYKEFKLSMRDAFVPSLLFSADYSQIEVRLMAHFSHDKLLLEILNTGGDVFRAIGLQNI